MVDVLEAVGLAGLKAEAALHVATARRVAENGDSIADGLAHQAQAS